MQWSCSWRLTLAPPRSLQKSFLLVSKVFILFSTNHPIVAPPKPPLSTLCCLATISLVITRRHCRRPWPYISTDNMIGSKASWIEFKLSGLLKKILLVGGFFGLKTQEFFLLRLSCSNRPLLTSLVLQKKEPNAMLRSNKTKWEHRNNL